MKWIVLIAVIVGVILLFTMQKDDGEVARRMKKVRAAKAKKAAERKINGSKQVHSNRGNQEAGSPTLRVA